MGILAAIVTVTFRNQPQNVALQVRGSRNVLQTLPAGLLGLSGPGFIARDWPHDLLEKVRALPGADFAETVTFRDADKYPSLGQSQRKDRINPRWQTGPRPGTGPKHMF